MNSVRYRIVFHGEVSLGYDSHEITENISRLTRWDVRKIEQLLASSHCIIKSDLDSAAADRMLNALNKTGIICRKEQMSSVAPVNPPPAPASTIAVVGRREVSDDAMASKCPKCGIPRGSGSSCHACGIIFAKYGQPRATVSQPAITAKLDSTRSAAIPRRGGARRNDPLARFEEGHPFGYYFGKLLLAILIALLLRALIRADLSLLVLLFLPVAFLLYIGALSAITERSFGELLGEHRSLLPIPSDDRERQRGALPVATYGLILLHLGVFLSLQMRTPVEILQQKWFFLPLDRSPETLVLSALAALFFHSGTFAFFAGLFFLWVIGASLERRIGSLPLVALYLFCGLVAAGAGVGIQRFLPGPPLPIMAAGGALAGLVGVFLFHSRLRTMTFPLPFLGLDFLIKGSPYRVRWSTFLIVTLLFLTDLGAPLETGAASGGNLALALLLSGLLCGLLTAYLFGMRSQTEGEEEDLPGGKVFTASEGELRRRLEANPDNPDLLVQLARVIAEVELTDEARQLYRRAIVGWLTNRPKDAAEIYREFNLRYQEVFEPKLTLRLASLYLRQGDTGMAVTLLASVCDDRRATPQEHEKALYQYGVTIARLKQLDEAYMVMRRFSDAFPESSLLPKLREAVYDAAQPQPG